MLVSKPDLQMRVKKLRGSPKSIGKLKLFIL